MFFCALLGFAVEADAATNLPSCAWFGKKDNCYGEETLPDGRLYVGEFKNGKRNGQGIVTSKEGYKFEGAFVQGLYEGKGELTVPPGWRYSGEFKQGRFNGQGVLTNPDGKVFNGNFKDDNYDGLGTLVFPDGSKYVGGFRNDKFHGEGTEFNADGTVRHAGVWEAGVYLDSDSLQPQLEKQGQARISSNGQVAVLAEDQGVPPAGPKLTSIALVIGNSNYSAFSKLPNPRNDARAIAKKLRSFGIDVDLILDADRGALVNALNTYQAKAAGRDVNIFFYAGHGVQVNGVNYLIPTDMRADGISAGYVKLNGVSVNDAMDYLPAKTRLVFLDACRDNPASRSLVASRSIAVPGLAPINAPSGTLISYATKDGTIAEDGNGANSPFTTALLEYLDARQDISIVLRKVRQRVLELTSGQQEPWEYGSLTGDQLIISTMLR
jgi:hypothetical protein